MEIVRKNKGSITYYLSKEDEGYRLVKKIKARSKRLIKQDNKTTKVTLSDLFLTESELHNLDFTSNGLRLDDEPTIRLLIKEFKNNGK